MYSASSADQRAPAHVRELLQFLHLYQDQGPGLLWPEHDRPAHDGPDATAALDAEARVLAELTALPVAIESHRAAEQGTRPHADASPGHLLVHQETGAGSWRLRTESAPPADGDARADGEAEESFRCRLRSNEVLYVPPGWSWQAELTAGAELLLTRLGPYEGGDGGGEGFGAEDIGGQGVGAEGGAGAGAMTRTGRTATDLLEPPTGGASPG
ncbi:hypothetical protein ACFWXK_20765 [Streptomyces sp. NPDC059070]|uniref:hypothetical protein n=1 Tax=unclassified Streptomyces TaxID=2593676 RepID=UPI0034E2A180